MESCISHIKGSEEKILANLGAVFFDRPELIEPLDDLDSLGFARLAHHHMIGARAWRLFSGQGSRGFLSKAALESLERGYLQSVSAHSAYGRLLAGLEFPVPWTVVKGISLARALYSPPFDRSFSDLDLVFYPEHREEVIRSMEKMGFVRFAEPALFATNAHKMDFRFRENFDLKVEVHFGLGPAFRILQIEDGWIEKFSGSAVEFCFLLYHGLVQHRLQKGIWLLDLRLAWGARGEAALPVAQKCGLGHAWNIARSWIEFPPDPLLRKILLAKVDGNPWITARVRALLMGGWGRLARYAAARHFAERGPE